MTFPVISRPLLIRRGSFPVLSSGAATGTGTATAIAPSPVDVLDLITPNPTIAFSSVRRLQASYAGNLIRVRRSSDDAEANIGVTGAGLLDQAALLAHCGAGNGFVVTWYDQGGSGFNLTHATAARQPKIVDAGVVITGLNSVPVIDFDRTAIHRLETTTPLSSIISASAYTYLASFRSDFGSNGAAPRLTPTLFCDGGTVDDGYLVLLMRATEIRAWHYDTGGYNGAVFTSITYPKTAVISSRFGGGTISGTMDGGAETTDASGNVDGLAATFQVGSSYTDEEHYDGVVGEIVFYNSQLSTADLNAIGAALAGVSGTTWTTVP